MLPSHLQNALFLAVGPLVLELLFSLSAPRQDEEAVFTHLVHLVAVILKSCLVVRALCTNHLQ